MSTYRILVSDPISNHGVEALDAHPDISVDVRTGMPPEELISIIGDYDGLVVRSQTKATAEVIDAAKRLRVIGRAGVGVDNIDRQAATAHGVVVMNTPTGNTVSTAEHAFALMLSLARNIPKAHATVAEGRWDRKKFKGIELYGKRLAILGMGRIGTEFARRALGFGMKVTAYDPFLTEARAQSLNVTLAESVEAALDGADVVTLHMPLNDETRHILDAGRIERLNRGALVVNCARGGLVDETAAAAAIESGRLAGMALDVYEQEPPSAEHPLFAAERVVFTPHLGASTFEAQENVGIQVAEQIRDYLTTGEIRNAVNMPSLDAETLAAVGRYLDLARSLGRLLAKLGPIQPDSLRVSYHGAVGEADTSLITRSALTGFLERASHEDQVNIVNAPAVAGSLGLELIESRISAKTEFSELIVAELRKDGQKFRVAGTIIGRTPRIVEIDRFFVDTAIAGHLLVVRNDDSPGIVGIVGTAIARCGLNIGNMSLARNKQRGNALSAIEVDSPVPPELLDELTGTPGITAVHAIDL
jgi:D-3-phosphoglycerate dehydrogenase